MILCVGDIHIKPNNVYLVDLLEKQIVKVVQEQKITRVVLLGDILDTFERVHTQAMNRAYALIDTLRKLTRVYVLIGNHDLINNQQFLSTEHWMNALKDWANVVVVDTVVIEDGLWFVPYVPVQRFREALETRAEDDWREARCIFAHQEFKGCKMGAINSTEGDEWALEWPMVVSGHIHDRQRPQANVYYIGASIQNAFGDQSVPVLGLVDPTPPVLVTELPLDLPRKKTVYLSITEAQQLQPEQLFETERGSVDAVRVVVKCDYEEFKVFVKSKEYETLSKHPKCKIVHKLPVQEPKEPDADKDSETSQGEFDAILARKVLQSKNEYVYAAFQDIVYGTPINPDDILIV